MKHSHFIERKKCPVCDSRDHRKIYECRYDEPPIRDYLVDFYVPQGTIEPEYLADASYVLCECDKCHAIFQRYIPGETLMERIYEHWIDPQKARVDDHEGGDLQRFAKYAQEIMQIVAFLGKTPSSLDLFDYGMGWGRWALMAKAFGCNSYGTELSDTRVAFARSNGIRCLTWNEIALHKFDFINTEQVFEHIPNPLATLRYLSGALKPGGIIKISVPPAHDIERRLKSMDWQSPKGSRNSLNAVAPLEHINCFRRTSIATMANEAGMQEVHIPMTLCWAYSTAWRDARQIAKNVVLPVYRDVLKRQNYVLLTNKQTQEGGVDSTRSRGAGIPKS